MKLLSYLNTNFIHTFTNDEIINHFITTFGVDVKNEDNLYLFKYEQLAANWQESLTHECRGCILRFCNNEWNVVCRSFNKFFNRSEGHSGLHTDEALEKFIQDNPNASLREKLDGSLMQIWFDDRILRWRASSSGMITPLNVGDNNFTFEELFWKTLWNNQQKKDDIFKYVVKKNTTLIFELCTTYNRVVTKYPTNHVVLLAIRNNDTGDYLPNDEVDMVAQKLDVVRPSEFSLSRLNIKDAQSLINFVEDRNNYDAKLEYPEGMILYNNGIPLAKIKRQEYLSLHSMIGGDTNHSVNCILESFFIGNIDDYYQALDDRMKVFVEDLRNWYILQLSIIKSSVDILKAGIPYATQKDYALTVLQKCNPKYKALFFNNRNKITDGSFSNDDVTSFFKENWDHHVDELKALRKSL